MKLGICQMNVVQGQVQTNRQTAERMIREAAQGADLVVLPEMWTSGYDFANLEKHAEELDGLSVQLLSNLAKELGVWIVGGSMPIRNGSGVSNTAVTFDSNGHLVHVYRKVHLIGLMDEDKYLVPGDDVSCFSLPEAIEAGETIDGETTAASAGAVDGGSALADAVSAAASASGDKATVGETVAATTLICYDLRFPELARGATELGAKVIFIPAEWPVQRKQHWDVLLTARAIENQAFVIGANMAGKNENDTFSGGSKVIDPWGNTVAEAGSDPTIFYADINLGDVDEVRNRVPSLRDRRPSVYAKITSVNSVTSTR